MKKNWMILLLTAALLLFLGGCGTDAPAGEADPDKDAVTTSAPVSGEQPAPAGTIMSLVEDGSLTIDRKTMPSIAMGPEGTWTFFVYLCGADLESDGGMATNDLGEMLDASTGSDVKFVVQTGGAIDWALEEVDDSSLERWVIQDGAMYLQDSQPERSMGDPETLSDFLAWGVANHPAAKMGLILWDHGGGSIDGVCFDERYDFESLSLNDLNTALSAVSGQMTDRFEFIGCDACLMSTLECANIFASYARYMIASEELESGFGWDYTAIGNYAAEHPQATGAELGRSICDSFYASCASTGEEDSATLAVVDLSRIDDVITALNDFSKNLHDASEDNAVYASVVRGINRADNFGGNNKSEGYTNMVDLAGLVAAGADFAGGADRVLSAVSRAVIYRKNGADHADACGLSTYYPLGIKGSSEFNTFGGIAVSPYYLSFVSRAAYGLNYGDTGGYDNSGLLDLWGSLWDGESGGQAESDAYWSEYSGMGVTGESPLIQFYDQPLILEDGSYGFSLTDESLANTASVQANVYVLSDDGEDLIELGISVDIYADWELGVFTDNFDGYWFSLPDGQTLAVYMVAECDGYDIYTSPVELNGRETNLRLTHDYVTGEVWIDGAWDGVDENGMAAREITPLSAGDTLVPLYYAVAVDSDDEYTYCGEEYTFDGDPEIWFDYLADGEYFYGFLIDDVYGDYLCTDFVNFSIEDGEIYYYDD